MRTVVITKESHDLGAGNGFRVTFEDCKWTVDDYGRLHVYAPQSGPVAAFAPGSWVIVTNGSVQAEDSE